MLALWKNNPKKMFEVRKHFVFQKILLSFFIKFTKSKFEEQNFIVYLG